MSRARFWRPGCAGLALLAVLSGCSTYDAGVLVNPYVSPRWSKADPAPDSLLSEHATQQNLAAQRKRAIGLRNHYVAAAGTATVTSRVVSGVLLTAAGDVLYNQTFHAKGNRRLLTGVGVLSGLWFAGAGLFLRPERDQVYRAGAAAVSCALDQSTPYYLPDRVLRQLPPDLPGGLRKASITLDMAAVDILSPLQVAQAYDRDGSVQALQAAQAAVDRTAFDSTVAAQRAALARVISSFQDELRRRDALITAAGLALDHARALAATGPGGAEALAADAQTVLVRVDAAPVKLAGDLDRIALQVNSALAADEPSLADIRSAVTALTPIAPASAQPAPSATDAPPSPPAPPPPPPPPPAAPPAGLAAQVEGTMTGPQAPPPPSAADLEAQRTDLSARRFRLVDIDDALEQAVNRLNTAQLNWVQASHTARLLVAEVQAREQAAAAASKDCSSTGLDTVSASVLGDQPLQPGGSVVLVVQAPSTPSVQVSPPGDAATRDQVAAVVSQVAAPNPVGQYAVTLTAGSGFKPTTATFVTITAGAASTILRLKAAPAG